MKRLRSRARRGQQAVEFALSFSALTLSLTTILIFTAQALWVWHSVAELTRLGAKYAASHCYQSGGANVIAFIRNNVPIMADRDSFRDGTVEIEVNYYQRDPDTGSLADFTCGGADCSTECIPDAVRVRVVNYQFRGVQSYFGLPAINLPNFETSLPVESMGCSAADGAVTCTE